MLFSFSYPNIPLKKKGYIQKEIRLALDTADQLPDGRIYVVPVRLEECEVPERLARWQWVDIFRNGGYERVRNTLSVRAKEISVNVKSKSNVQAVDLPPVTSKSETKTSAPTQLASAGKKSSLKKKFSPTMIAAIIGAIATIFAGILSSPLLDKLISPSSVAVTVVYDGKSDTFDTPINSPVSNILIEKGITLGALDRVEPPLNTFVTRNEIIKVIRVREEFVVQQAVMLFDRQVVKNSSLAEGETRLIQSGTNGLQETTTRVLYEDNVKTSESIVKTEVLLNPVPEIVMIGIK